MNKILNYIGSRRFAVYLLTITTSVILLTNLLPKVSLMDAQEVEDLKKKKPILYAVTERVGIESLVSTPYFQIIPVIIFISIGICTIRRIKTELERERRVAGQPGDYAISLRLSIPAASFDRERAEEFLSKKGWKRYAVLGMPEQISAAKGDYGIWGSILFHVGMEIALIGILVSVIFGIEGKGYFTEGFPASTKDSLRWSQKNAAADFPLMEVMLESFTPVFEKGFPVAYTSRIAAVGRDNRLRRYEIGVNKYLIIDDYKVIFNRGGYAPKIKLKKGDSVSELVANLKIFMPGDLDSFRAPEEGLRFDVEMFPDFYRENGQPKTKSKYPFNPVLFVEIKQDGKMIGRGFLEKGKEVSFDKYTLEFQELKHWVEILVSKDAGVPVITLGFILTALGLSTRFLLNERRLWVIITRRGEEVELAIGWRARFFPAMFEEEMKELAEGIKLEFRENRI